MEKVIMKDLVLVSPRAHGIITIRQEELVIEHIQAHGKIERKHVMDLCGLNSDQASRLLKKMCKKGKILPRGSPPRWVYYELAEKY